ncbi:unnamed protein product [Caenorhabditis angaria]|uniref:Receptor L-domain domain-containing protein n=1 Tax=Caenorhabditis angaria TaxID=860376 RepID=A0A9P1N222_9PELO|nr:unnamed protein product [Caenorhabditis angaria]
MVFMLCLLFFYLIFFITPSSSEKCTISNQNISEIDDNCEIINGNVVLDEKSDEKTVELFIKKLSQVRQIFGSVVVTNTSFVKLDFLPKLRSIVYTPVTKQYSLARQHALYIVNNKFLESMNLPNIEIAMNDVFPTDMNFFGTSIYDNPVLCFDFQTLMKFYKFPRFFISPKTLCDPQILEETKMYTKYTDANSTKVFCYMEYFNYSMPLGCQILEKPLVVDESDDGTNNLFVFQEAIKTVEIILGPIFITDSTATNLNFSSLELLNNMYFDYEPVTSLQNSVIFLKNNTKLLMLSFPKSPEIYHYGTTSFIYTELNTNIVLNDDLCKFVKKLYMFDFNDKFENCVINYIEIFDINNYGHVLGLQFLLFSNKRSYFYQLFNIIYTNRLSLLCSCSLYRTVSFISLNSGKFAIFLAFLIFVISNISTLGGLAGKGSQYSFVLYPFTWFTFILTISTSIFLTIYLRISFKNHHEIRKHQLKLSFIFCSQAIIAFGFCGFPDAFFESWLQADGMTQLRTTQKTTILEFVRSHTVFSYRNASIIVRWQYPMYAFMLRLSIKQMLKKVSTKASKRN